MNQHLTKDTDLSNFACIVADPPWASMHQRSTYHRGKPERHYGTMPLEDIKALPVGDVAAPDAHLWLWAVNRLLGQAYEVVEAWGFTPMSVLTWCKPGPGMGYYLRNNTEHCIFATRGKPMVPETKALSTWHVWPRRKHSEKPEEFFDIVETVSPGPRLELFSRREREGWLSWGLESENSAGISLVPANNSAQAAELIAEFKPFHERQSAIPTA